MAASGLLENPSSQTKPEQQSSFRRHSMNAKSCDTSGSSISSEMLGKSGANVLPHTSARPSLDASDCSHSSTSSVRVRIKAKYLKERRSPFEKGDITADQPKLPPALPSNLPKGYERRKDIADVYSNSHQLSDFHSGIPESPETSSKVSSSQIQSFPPSTPARNHLKDPKQVPGEVLTSGDSTVPLPVSKEVYPTGKVKTAAKTSGILRQGEVPNAAVPQGAPWGQPLDVRVIQYGGRGKRQQVMSEQLSKRHGNKRPTTRVVQPKLIVSNKPIPSQPASAHPQTDSGSMVTASAAAAAAVAATVPLLKTQSDLESKMSHIMEKLSILEHAGPGPPPQPMWAYPQGPGWGVEGPGAQHRLEELTRLQLEHLEQLQTKQQELQAAMTELSRGNFSASTGTGPSSATGPRTGAQSPNANEPSSQSASRDRRHGRRGASGASEPSGTAPSEGANPSEMSSQIHTVSATFKPELNQNNLNTADPPRPAKRVPYTPAVTFHGLSQGLEPGVTSSERQKDDAQQAEAPSQDDILASGNEAHGIRSSPLDTPAPRRHAPVPHARGSRARITHLGKGLLEEILSSHDEDERTIAKRQGVKGTASSPQIGNSLGLRSEQLSHILPVAEKNYARSDILPDNTTKSSADALQAQRVTSHLNDVNEAAKTSLKTNQLQEENADSLHAPLQSPPEGQYRKISRKLRQEAERDMERRRQAWLGPAPLDEYLRRNRDAEITRRLNPPPLPTSKLLMSPSQSNAPVTSPLCAEAQALLRRVQSSREVLEANLETVDRARDGEHFYQAIHDMCIDGNASDLAWIKHAVDLHISAIDSEIKKEIRQGKLEQSRRVGHRTSPPRLSPSKPSRASQLRQPPDDKQKPAIKQGKPFPAASAPGKIGKARVQAKIDTGLRQLKKQEPRVEVKGRDPNVLEQDKENLPKRKGDEAMARYQGHVKPYGSPLGHNPRLTSLQPLRSTLKDAPYLHFANQTPTKAKKPVAHLASALPAKEHQAAQTQTKSLWQHQHRQGFQPGPQNQYFFHPYSSQEVAGLTSVSPQPAPAHGQLVPMAVPLGKPRGGIGLPRPVTISSGGREGEEVESHPASQQPAISNNVEERANVAVVGIVASEEKPRLTIQHLPNVDIETAPPTPASSQEDAHPNVTPQIKHHEDTEEEEDPDDDCLPGSTGIALQGVTERQPSYHGPVFPPRQPPPTEPARVVSSDQLAADITHRELLQNRAVEWVEQELMAKLISEMYFRQPDLPPAARRERPRSVSPVPSEEDGDLHAMGGGGLQLFVDAGQAVDPALVSGLVQEVLEEKIALCLGQREQERSSFTLPCHSQDERQPSPQPVRQRSPLQTPPPTPPASPILHSFREPSPAPGDRILTPEASIAGDVEVSSCAAESETESVKDLVHDQAASKEAPTIALPGPSAVVTPPTTPPPISIPSPQNFLLDRDAPTPQPSPRGSPTPLEAPHGPLVTPSCTPEPQSPTTPEPEEDVFRETPFPTSPEPQEPSPLPPAPSPSPPPKPATPAPDSVDSSSSTTTTETTPQDTTTTQSTGREISEGEWLVSKSEEGRVPDETLFDVPEMEAFEESSQSSSTSTVKAPVDPDKDQEDPRSEGEVHPSQMRLTRDPVVALLARLHQGVAGPEVAVPPPVTQPSAMSSPLTISSGASSSVGEVSDGQRPSLQPPAEHMLYQRAYQSPPPLPHGISQGASNEDVGSTEEEGEVKDGEGGRIKSGRHVGVVKVTGGVDAAASSAEGIPVQSQHTHVTPVIPSPVARVINVGGGSATETGQEEEMEEEESVGHPDRDMPEADMKTHSIASHRDRPPPPSLFSTMASDPGTRTMTPDAMNMDALLKSGYLSQTFSQTEGEGGTMSEGSGLLAQMGNSGFNVSGTIPRGSSHLATSGMFSEDSLEVAVRGSQTRAREQRSFQVTLPSIASPDGQEAGESLSEGELHPDDSISDVSEMTL